MTHPIIEDLQWRYATKKYDPQRKVSVDDLNVFYQALRLSASSINSQPWRFIVIQSERAKQRMCSTYNNKHRYNQAKVMESTVTILFAHNPAYTRDDYAKVVDKGIADKRTAVDDRDKAFEAFRFAEYNTDETGNTGCWTKAQTYLALGNALHILARLRIDSTPLEGIDAERVNEEFAEELAGYRCEVALAIGYHDPEQDFNAKLPKSRLAMEEIFKHI